MIPPGARVYVLDDDASFVRSTVRLLASWDVDAEGFSSPVAFLEHEPVATAACLLLDVRMPGMSGLQVQRAVAARPRPLPVVFVSGHADLQASVEAMKAGAVDFLTKPVDQQRLMEAVQRALEADECAQTVRRRAAALGPAEREVCRLVVTGMRDDQIAAALGWAEPVVRAARQRAMQALAVGSLVDLVHALEAARVD